MPSRPSRKKVRRAFQQLELLEPRVLMSATFDRSLANPPLMPSPIYDNPLRRIRPTQLIIPDSPPVRQTLLPPVLPGTNTTVDLTLGDATTNSATPLGINIDQLTYWGQGNAINSLIPQGGTFERGDGRIMVQTSSAGSSASTLIVDNSWVFSTIGYGVVVGNMLTATTGQNAGRSFRITSMQSQLDASHNPTGRAIITVSPWFFTTPVAGDIFYVALVDDSAVPLADNLSTQNNAVAARDNSVAHTGQSSLAITFGSGAANSASIQYYTSGDNVLQQSHVYQLTYWAKTAAAATAAAYVGQGQNSGRTQVNLIADNQWHQYALTVLATNPVVAGAGNVTVKISGTNSIAYVDDIKLIDLSDQIAPNNPLSKTVVNLVTQNGYSTIRFWHPALLGASLDDLIGPAGSRPSIIGVTYPYSPQLALPEMLELARETNTTPWIVIPTTWSAGEMQDLLQYLAGDVTTPYGAKRAADGHAASWFSDLPGIKIEAGNESWNSTFAPYNYSTFETYFARAQTMFQAVKSDPLYTSAVAGKLKLIVNGWQWVPWFTQTAEADVPAADAVDVSAYTGGPNTEMPINNLLDGVLSSTAAMDTTDYPPSILGKPVYVYEEAPGELGNTVSAATESAYATSLGAGLAVIRNAMVLTRDYGISSQNLFTMFQRGLNMKNGYALGHYGIYADMSSAESNPRPIALAARLLNQATGTIIESALTPGWSVDPASSTAAATTTPAADAMVTLSNNQLVITLFNNTAVDALTTTFHLLLPSLLAGRTINPNWSAATFTMLSGPSVSSNNETAQTVSLTSGQFTHSSNEIYAALPAHSMGSLVIPLE